MGLHLPELKYIGRMTWTSGRREATLLVLLALLVGGAVPLGAWAFASLLDQIAAGSPHQAYSYVWLLAIVGVVATGGGSLSHVTQRELNRKLTRAAKERLFSATNRIQRLDTLEDPAFHNRMRLAQQIGTVAPQQIAGSFSGLAQSVITLLGLACVLAQNNPLALLVLGLVAVPTGLAAYAASRDRADMMWRTSGRFRREMFYAGLLTEPRAAQEIRLLGLAGEMQNRMRVEFEAIDAEEQLLDVRYLKRQGSLHVMGAVVLSGVTVVIALAAMGNRLSIGTLSLVVAAATAFQSATGSLLERLADSHQSLRLFGNFRELVDQTVDQTDEPAAEPRPQGECSLGPLRQGIRVRQLTFSYSTSTQPVLSGLTMDIPFGETTAIVGLNGAGKSTLVKLLCGLYRATSGTIEWDGTNIDDADVASLRARIAVVFQDFMQYELTAADNIGLGLVGEIKNVTLIEEAATAAGADHLVRALPDRYNTMLSRTFFDDDEHQGVMLSGGQWQRLAIARAYMRADSDVIVLDEPSSGLDARAEREVHEGLKNRRTGRTNILISHRLSAVRDADHIYVLAEGQVCESGDHTSLMAADGEYAAMFRLQAQGYVDPEPVSVLAP